ncbi:hypothetical protein H2198_005217 [Neophaeococcomyces mojaviensis]|uniref:Uncharacterized protein n=1 Tax=Neophaeococcomyces mojaviensis TaxID=3383035 RepID=A0ACC3A6V7_9EURO|nr:hypothetical protein H2198_005217 [Knufia sp. JES_112]
MGASDGILGQEYWQSVKEKQSQYAATRTGKWALNLVRPAIFERKTSPGRLRSTAYLDGLRGFAALLVYWGHHQLWAHDSIKPEDIFENAFGYNKQYYFATVPGIRMFFSGGHFAVSVFFIISGYVLSVKPLQLIHAGEHLAVGDNLTSALFRRWLRLYIPLICVTFLYMTSWHVLGFRTDVAPEKTYGEELWRWYKQFKDFSFIFKAEVEPAFAKNYGFHLWSIPTELRGSIVVYTALLAFSRATRNARLLCTVGLMLYFLYIVDGWYCAMFTMGMLQCDLDLQAANKNLPAPLMRLSRFQRPISYTLFAVGIYLGGCPAATPNIQVLKKSPGWSFLTFLKPEAIYDYKWFFLFCASTCTVASIQRIPILKQFFESRFNQYLGHISFAFYLVHGPILWTVGDRLYAATGWIREQHAANAARWINIAPIPNVGPLGLELNFLAPHILILPITLWSAEIITRVFDEPSVRFMQWLYSRTLDRSEKF